MSGSTTIVLAGFRQPSDAAIGGSVEVVHLVAAAGIRVRDQWAVHADHRGFAQLVYQLPTRRQPADQAVAKSVEANTDCFQAVGGQFGVCTIHWVVSVLLTCQQSSDVEGPWRPSVRAA